MVRLTHLINSREKVTGRLNSADLRDQRGRGGNLEFFLDNCTLVASRTGAGVFPETRLLDQAISGMFGDRGVGTLTAEEVADLVY